MMVEVYPADGNTSPSQTLGEVGYMMTKYCDDSTFELRYPPWHILQFVAQVRVAPFEDLERESAGPQVEPSFAAAFYVRAPCSVHGCAAVALLPRL